MKTFQERLVIQAKINRAFWRRARGVEVNCAVVRRVATR